MKCIFQLLNFLALTLLIGLLATTIGLAPGAAVGELTWKQVNLPGGLPARSFFATAYDPVSQKIVVFGGSDASGQLGDTWTFDGDSWTEIQTSPAPGTRAAATMAYDSATQKIVLWGGFVGFTFLNDTWLWDGATSTWTQANPQTVPKGATNPMLFTDPVNGHVDMFGGYQGQFYSRFMWQGT